MLMHTQLVFNLSICLPLDIEGTSAISGKGLDEALSWLYRTLTHKDPPVVKPTEVETMENKLPEEQHGR